MTTGFTFLTTGFKLTMGCSFSLTMVFKCPWGRVQKWTPPLPTAAHFQTGSKIKQGIPAAPTVPEPLVFSGFPDILFMPFVSNKQFTFLSNSPFWYNFIFPILFYFASKGGSNGKTAFKMRKHSTFPWSAICISYSIFVGTSIPFLKVIRTSSLP